MKKSFAISAMFILAIILAPISGNAAIGSGNWFLQASTQMTAGGSSQIPQIGGSLSQTGSSISGVLHVSNSGCFDWATDLAVSGTVNGTSVALTSDGANGEVLKINGTENGNQITGTYSIASGCADGDFGAVTAMLVTPATGNWAGTISGDGTAATATAALTQGAPNAGGYSPLTGTVGVSGKCTLSGSLVDGQSWVLGNVVQAVVNLNDGSTLAMNGFITDLPAGNEITVNVSLSGGACSGLSGSVIYQRK